MTATPVVTEQLSAPTTPHLPPPPAPPTLKANVGRRPVEMELTDLRIDVRAAGLVAQTTLVLTFRNPHARELEGDLLVPLPDGATICGFGLDVEGQLVDASLVEHHRAREVFEHEARRPTIIDPGLAEHVRGNVFRTRVYPLPARGRRQVKLEYIADLPVIAGRAILDLPLPSTGTLNHLDVRVEVARALGHPVADGDAWGDSAFHPVGDAFVAELHRRHAQPTRLRVILPDVPRSSAVVQLGPDDRRYFALHHLSDKGPGDDLPTTDRSIRLAWDASLSRATTDKQREFDTLRDLLRRLGDVDIDLVVFRHVAQPPRRFTIQSGDARELLHHLAHLVYDGATTASALAAALSHDADRRPAFTLLVSDGLITLGPTPDGALAHSAAPVFTLTAADLADHHLLRRLAHPTGGAFLNLARLTPDTAAPRLGRAPHALLSIDVLAGAVEDLLPAAPCPLDEFFTLTGRLATDRATLRLNFGRGTTVTDSVTCELPGDTATPGTVVPRLWAQHKAATLSPSTAAGRAKLLELGRTFGLVTPGTSLLVLETLWQHLEHRIEPAPTRTTLYRQYHEAVARDDADPRRRQPRLDADYATRVEVIRFYARLRLGEDVDPTWVAEQTRGHTAADLCEMIDMATFLARSRGHAKVDLNDLLTASPALRYADKPSPAKRLWTSRLAWHNRTFKPPEEPVPTVLPYDAWLNDDRGVLNTDLRFSMSRHATIDKTLDRSVDRSVDIDGISRRPSAALVPPSVETRNTTPPPPPGPVALPPVAGELDVAEANYLRFRDHHAADPDFYASWADLFLARGWRDAGLRVLSNLAEILPDDVSNLRAAAYALEAAGEDALAADVYEQLLALRPEEPQSCRDLALVLERLGRHQRAADLLAAVVTGQWDDRFDGIEGTALTELAALVARHRRQHPGAPPLRVDLDLDLSQPLDLDLRVVLDWNTDMTDLNLWLLEPTGQLAAPNATTGEPTRIGGHVPHGMWGGLGPEEYLLRRACPGDYRVKVQYAADRHRRLDAATSFKVTIYRNYARPDETRQTFLLRKSRRPLPAPARNVGTAGCLAFGIGALATLWAIEFGLRFSLWTLLLGPAIWALAIAYGAWVGRLRRRNQQNLNVFDVARITVPAPDPAQKRTHGPKPVGV